MSWKLKLSLLKKELEDQAKIHDRLDVAIEKLTDVSNSINRMLAVHEEKIARQEEAITLDAEQQIELRRSEMMMKIDELHSRITTNTKEIMTAAAKQHANQNREIQKITEMRSIFVLVFLKNGDTSLSVGLSLLDFYYTNLSISLDKSLMVC